jgi:hypothetical protein
VADAASLERVLKEAFASSDKPVLVEILVA